MNKYCIKSLNYSTGHENVWMAEARRASIFLKKQ